MGLRLWQRQSFPPIFFIRTLKCGTSACYYSDLVARQLNLTLHSSAALPELPLLPPHHAGCCGASAYLRTLLHYGQAQQQQSCPLTPCPLSAPRGS